MINNTTRTFPRTTAEAFPNNHYDLERQRRWEWMEGSRSDIIAQAEYWVHMTLAFAAGFIVHQLWG